MIHGAVLGGHEGQDSRVLEGSRVERSVPAAGIAGLRARVRVGALKVAAAGPGEIRVHAVRKYGGRPTERDLDLMRRAKVEIQSEGNALIIRDLVPPELESGSRTLKNFRLEMEIALPAGLNVAAESGVGSIRLDGRLGDIDARSGVGDVEMRGEARAVQVHSGVGQVRLDGLRCIGKRLEAHNGTGDVSLKLSSLPSRELTATSGVGSVTAEIPASSRASVTMDSGVGGIRTDFPLNRPRPGIVPMGASAAGDINGGGVRVRLHTGTGDARLLKGG